jgi:hypothetical protein
MRIVRRRLAPGEFDHEMVWLAVSLAAVVGGAVWLRLGLLWPQCPFLAMTGYPCLTCGATRCSIAFFHADVARALSWNPLVLVALFGVVLFDVYAAIVLVTRGARLRVVDWTRMEKRMVRIAVVALIAVNWAYLLAHRAQFCAALEAPNIKLQAPEKHQIPSTKQERAPRSASSAAR